MILIMRSCQFSFIYFYGKLYCFVPDGILLNPYGFSEAMIAKYDTLFFFCQNRSVIK